MEVQKREADYTMIDWWKKVVFKNYANFDGRARRAEYWYFTLFSTIAVLAYIFLAFSIVGLAQGFSSDEYSDILVGLLSTPLFFFWIALLVPNIAVSVRRLHDTGKSGWWILIGVIPCVHYIGGIVLLIFYCIDSDYGDNEYGPNPKYNTDFDEINRIGEGRSK